MATHQTGEQEYPVEEHPIPLPGQTPLPGSPAWLREQAQAAIAMSRVPAPAEAVSFALGLTKAALEINRLWHERERLKAALEVIAYHVVEDYGPEEIADQALLGTDWSDYTKAKKK